MQTPAAIGDSPEAIAADVRAVAQIDAVSTLLQVLCETTGMGFAAVARVTARTWTACAVRDELNVGLKPGGQLDVDTTLCRDVRATRTAIVIDHASTDPVYAQHPTPRIYRLQSYVSVPILLPDGRYFGNLCALDPQPRMLSEPRIVSMFNHFASLIGKQLDREYRHAQDQSALRDERAASELREQFIAILGHDLRNPLAAVLVTADLLARKAQDPLLSGLAARIKTNARRMSGLIDDVLDFARGRLGGGIGVQCEPIEDLAHALLSVVKELQDSHPQRCIVSEVQVTQPVHGDVARLQQVTSNLIANALTHGAPASVVKLTVATTDAQFLLKVWNDGEPIPSAMLEKIFQPFWRHSTLDARQGLGLGLYICAEIAKAHGGELSVTSTRQGTEFVVRFPLSAPAGPPASTAAMRACHGLQTPL